jgi:hypothetical protein
MNLNYMHEGKKVLKINAELDSSNINIKKGILGKLNFKRLNKFTVAMVYGGIIRKEKIDGMLKKERENCYQSIQLISGHPRVGTYRFFFPMPKNYTCESVNKITGNFEVDFEFILKVVTNEGPFIAERIPITIYRVKE